MPHRRASLFRAFLTSIGPASMLIVFTFLFVFAYLLPKQKEMLLRQTEETSKQLIQIMVSQIEYLESRVSRNELSRDSAQSIILKRFDKIRYGQEGHDYVWVIGPDTTLWLHPYRKDFLHIKSDSVLSPGNIPMNQLIREMWETAHAHNLGIYNYTWEGRQNKQERSRKRAVLRYYAPWNWVIGTGIYLDEVEERIGTLRTQLIIAGSLLTIVVSLLSLFLSLRSYRLHSSLREALQKAELGERQFKLLFENSPTVIIISDLNSMKVRFANSKATKLFHVTAQELIGRDFSALGWQSDYMNGVLNENRHEIHNTPVSIMCTDNEVRNFLISASLMESPSSGEKLQISFLVDITHFDRAIHAKDSALQSMQSQYDLINQAYQNSYDAVVITNAKGEIVTVNPSFTMITGYTLEEARGKTPAILKSGQHEKEFYAEMWRQLKQDGRYVGEVINQRKNGEIYPTNLSINALRNAEGEITSYVAVSQDLSELRLSQDQVKIREQRDILTGLVNQATFEKLLKDLCSSIDSAQQKIAVIHIGLDRFNRINNAFGFSVGDMVLRESAVRIQSVMGKDITVSRLAGDEFGTWLVMSQQRECDIMLEQLQTELKKPFHVGEHAIILNACIGISVFPDDTRRADSLLRNSLQAMEHAKQIRIGSTHYFTKELQTKIQRNVTLEEGIRRAFDQNEFEVFFQPKVSINGGTPIGMEALMRWFSSDGTAISPAEFIPVVEHMGEIERLGQFALDKSCQWAKQWTQDGYPLIVSVNVSAQQLYAPGFVSQVIRTLERHRFPGSQLELEITESTFMQDSDRAQKIMGSLINEGIRFSLDDFGTGYSSLSQIRSLPISGLKIDKSFIDDIAQNRETAAIVRMLKTLSNELNLEVTIEGVESEDQVQVLKEISDDLLIQGYFFAKPMSAKAFGEYLRNPKK